MASAARTLPFPMMMWLPPRTLSRNSDMWKRLCSSGLGLRVAAISPTVLATALLVNNVFAHRASALEVLASF